MKRYLLALFALVFISYAVPTPYAPAWAVVATTENIESHTGNGVTTEFAFPNIVLDEGDIEVTVSGTLKTITTDYTVAGVGDEDGVTVTFLSAPADAAPVVIRRVVNYIQQTDLSNFDGNPSDVIEEQFDLLTMQTQQLGEISDRSLKFPVGEDNSSVLPDEDDRADKILVFDEDGDLDVSDTDWSDIEDDIEDLSGAVTDAETAATSASSSATAAASSASSASASASSAGTSATEAASSAASVDFSWEGAWVTSTAYEPSNMVFNDGSAYVATSTHTSGASTEPGTGASWDTVWDLMAQQGSAGAGTGDMLAANNLSDVASASTAFTNIKQAASDTATGVVELATDAEAQALADTGRALTPANLAAVTGTETRTGVLELATDAEAQTGTDTARAITPANLQAVTATESRKGVAELATTSECTTGTDTARVCTPAGVAAAISGSSAAGGDNYLIEVQTASGASVDFDNFTEADCTALRLVFNGLTLTSGSGDLYIRTSSNNGSSYDSGNNTYKGITEYYTAIDTTTPSQTIDDIVGLGATNANRFTIYTFTTSNDPISGELTILDINGTTANKSISGYFLAHAGDDMGRFQGYRNSTGDIDALQIGTSASTFSGGTVLLYCLKDS